MKNTTDSREHSRSDSRDLVDGMAHGRQAEGGATSRMTAIIRWQLARRVVPTIHPAHAQYSQQSVKPAISSPSLWGRVSKYVRRYQRKVVPATAVVNSEMQSVGSRVARVSTMWAGARTSALRISRTTDGDVDVNLRQQSKPAVGDHAAERTARASGATMSPHPHPTLAEAKQHQGWHGTQYLGVYCEGIYEGAKDMKARKDCRTLPEVAKQVSRLWDAITTVRRSLSQFSC